MSIVAFPFFCSLFLGFIGIMDGFRYSLRFCRIVSNFRAVPKAV